MKLHPDRVHLREFKLQCVRGIAELEWRLPDGVRAAGWHVIIGDNGSGKSSLFRAIALAFVGKKNADALRQDWSTWVSGKATEASIRLTLQQNPEDQWSGPGRTLENFYPRLRVNIKRNDAGASISIPSHSEADPLRHAWNEKPGWFSASFGPFRRFTGGNKDSEKLFYTHPKLAPHLSIFGEDIALTECIEWIQSLRFKQLEGDAEGALLDELRLFINQDGFLPHGVQLGNVDSKGVRFVDGNGLEVPVIGLGDGFRSVLSFTFELLRQLAVRFGPQGLLRTDNGKIVVTRSGVVLIDEVDAHLHPAWQRKIGFWLTEHFPNIQFLVSTHSPLVCQAAEHGSIFQLPTPGSDGHPRHLLGTERDRLIFGSVLDAYGTELFGNDVSRSPSAQAKQRRLAELNQRAIGGSLSESELAERASLQALFPSILS